MLKKAGVGEAIAMDLVGHDSVAISRHYIHVDFQTKYEAINKLPELWIRLVVINLSLQIQAALVSPSKFSYSNALYLFLNKIYENERPVFLGLF